MRRAALRGRGRRAGIRLPVAARGGGPNRIFERDMRASTVRVADVDLVEALGVELIAHFTIDARRVRPERATEAVRC